MARFVVQNSRMPALPPGGSEKHRPCQAYQPWVLEGGHSFQERVWGPQSRDWARGRGAESCNFVLQNGMTFYITMERKGLCCPQVSVKEAYSGGRHPLL